MVEEKENQENWEKELEENWDYLIYHSHEVRNFIRQLLQQARKEEKERQFNMLMKCLPKDAENLSTLTPDQAKRLIECFIQNRPWD